jgi:hypothetical protein
VITAVGLAPQALLHSGRRPVQGGWQVGALDEHLRHEVAQPRIAPSLRLQLADQSLGLG